MEYLALTLIGGSILFIIFLLLPIKIALSQKVLFVALAILFSHIFLWLHSFLALWQAGLILILLILTTALGITKFIFTNTNNDRESGDSENLQGDSRDQLLNGDQHTDLEEINEVITEAPIFVDEIENMQLLSENEKQADDNKITETPSDIVQNRFLQTEPDGEVVEEEQPIIKEQVEKIPLREEQTHSMIKEDTEEQLMEKEVASTDQLLSLHDLGEDKEEHSHERTEETEAVSKNNKEEHKFNRDEVVEEVLIEPHQEEKDLQLNEDDEAFDDEEKAKEETEEKTHVDQEEETVEEAHVDHVEEAVEEAHVDHVEEAVEEAHVDHVEEDAEGTHIDQEAFEETFTTHEEKVDDNRSEIVPNAVPKPLNRDLMDTLVGQLLWYKEQIHPQDFEQLVLEHAKDGLHDNDYYLFASILRDHYIETEQFDKLKTLLNRLKQRYNNKMVIKEEITFFEKKFFQS
ncbi:hypothetical protein BKP35_14415 [Anaerobacillus arseniciselenatis]|uniref:Uncharacterized protein n=1 Tax=Anaerobacillus arseniciselenatis TaxID=85682 RepID=A0A1S2LCR1_9BACI|nr:hypothetical protein [Anaerobacillus arseniciselenatis]OIJ10288.1 hypothetical protein BKP35_14415 [Anaerobacillus arseniciselenatis]